MFAMLGSLLCGVGSVVKCVGLYQAKEALVRPNFPGPRTEKVIIEDLLLMTRQLEWAGETLGQGNLVLLAGGGFVAYALHSGSFRGRWFFWSTLAFSLFFVWQPVVGTVYGVWWLCILIVKRSEFFAKQAILVSG